MPGPASLTMRFSFESHENFDGMVLAETRKPCRKLINNMAFKHPQDGCPVQTKGWETKITENNVLEKNMGKHNVSREIVVIFSSCNEEFLAKNQHKIQKKKDQNRILLVFFS